MSMPRSLVIAAALAALLVATIAAPVAAAKTKLAIVNGVPGKKVDVCVNGREVKSGLRYGRFFFKTTRTAKATVKFYKRDPRRCGGKLLAKRTSGIDDGTWIVTRRHPLKIVVFDNSFLATPMGASEFRAGWRHAADLGAVELSIDIDGVGDVTIIDMSADDSEKGEAAFLNEAVFDGVLTTKFKRGGAYVVRPDFRWIGDRAQRRLEWILVGSAIANAKIVHIDRPGAPL